MELRGSPCALNQQHRGMNRHESPCNFEFTVLACRCEYAVRTCSQYSVEPRRRSGWICLRGAPIAPSALYQVTPAGKTNGGGHDTESLVKFDLTSLGAMTAAQVTSATLSLHVSDVTPTGFGLNPTGASPIDINLYPALAAWNRATLQWSNKPAVGSLISSVNVNSNNYWITYNVTSQVQGWLTNPASNFGLLLSANAIVGGPGNYTIAAFSSGFGNQSGNAPYLTVVPEPSSIMLALGLVPVAAFSFWQRRRKQK